MKHAGIFTLCTTVINEMTNERMENEVLTASSSQAKATEFI
jgi:hypothetical protein